MGDYDSQACKKLDQPNMLSYCYPIFADLTTASTCIFQPFFSGGFQSWINIFQPVPASFQIPCWFPGEGTYIPVFAGTLHHVWMVGILSPVPQEPSMIETTSCYTVMMTFGSWYILICDMDRCLVGWILNVLSILIFTLLFCWLHPHLGLSSDMLRYPDTLVNVRNVTYCR